MHWELCISKYGELTVEPSLVHIGTGMCSYQQGGVRAIKRALRRPRFPWFGHAPVHSFAVCAQKTVSVDLKPLPWPGEYIG